MNLTLDQLRFGAAAINGVPVQSTDQMRFKAVWLELLADAMDTQAQNATVAQAPEPEKA